MRLKCLGCEVFARGLYTFAAQSPHQVDITLLEYGLHNRPAELRRELQARIDAAAGQDYQAVLLAYGLCGKATAGLRAVKIPLVIPKAHDCITIFLGSRARYTEQFEDNPGTYWYTQDYIERRKEGGSALSLGSGTDVDLEAVYDQYIEKYGQDNADYLMEVMGAWQRHYQRAVYIDLGIGDSSAVEALAQSEAARRGWAFERLAGDLRLIRQLLSGVWASGEAEDLLVLGPGEQIEMSFDDQVLCRLVQS
jgi:hypothetical protein